MREVGQIDDTPDRPIRSRSQPDAADLARTGKQGHQPCTDSASVIRAIEARRDAETQAAAPSPVTPKQLRELHIRLNLPEAKKAATSDAATIGIKD